MDMSTLLERLRQLPNNTIVLYTNFVEDAAGARFVGASQSNPMIASAANAPVFVLSDVDLGTGTVGGDMVSFASDGKIAGDIVMRILNGEKAQNIPIVKNANVFMFDWRALQRWGLKEGNLPPASIVLNRPPNVWKLFKWYIIGGVSLMLLEALLISGLVWQRARRRQAETQLSIAYETALESERRFRLVANTAPVMIWMSGRDKLWNYFNRPWLEFTGRPLEAELGNGWLEGVHPEDLKNCLDIYTRAFDSHESFKTQCRLRRHDGEYRWVLDIGVPRLNPDGSFAGYIGSCLDITDHKLADEALAQVGRKLIQAHEEERTWIARELHDDINQRIALLTVQLGVLAQDPPDSGVEVADHIRHVRQDLADLGNDIQSLSHRLHSSKLDLLGLAAAAGGFCRELSEQQKVEIEFRHTGIPRSLPQEISLCLFRVLQEALQNAVKHSGTRHFEVELHGNAEQIELAVRDRGEGFDVEAAAHRSGLGLISMGERVSLVKGTMLIASTPKGGTEIKVRVPLTASDATFRSEATFRSISTG
jgi:PAS domain S-box-containing protein